MPQIDIQAELVVAAAEGLDDRVYRADHAS